MFDRIGTTKSRYFGIIDLTQELKRASTFITYNDVRQYTRLPFGMKGGPSWFQQHLARTVLKDYLYDICELYIDDILVFAETDL